MSAADVIAEHERSGRYIVVDGVRTFIREQGEGEVVLCMHGVPVSCFVYRRVLAELAARGLRAVTFDLPGLGLSDRPEEFDYTWTGLGAFATKVVNTLGLDRFHLLVHDLGGPVGFELASHVPDRVRSLTVLDTVIAADEFVPPWTMRPFRSPILGPVWLASVVRPVFRQLMFLQGIHDRSAVSVDELDAHYELLRRKDNGRAFLKIMQGFELTKAKRDRFAAVLADERYPRRVVWGEFDPALTLAREGAVAKAFTKVDVVHTVPAKHFLQEDQAPAIAEHVRANADAAG